LAATWALVSGARSETAAAVRSKHVSMCDSRVITARSKSTRSVSTLSCRRRRTQN
jgi:hypothetical protein